VEDAATVKLVNAIFLVSLKKQASEFRVVRDDQGGSRVDFCIAGVWHEEMRPPTKLHAVIVRRLAIMANLPMYAKGEAARGQIRLIIGDATHDFRAHIEGHGSELVAYVRLLKEPYSSSGSGASSSG
jgi:type II secretory ATPase GspE/PulE/Tfp pilus assembly ATPase PilB-like protein